MFNFDLLIRKNKGQRVEVVITRGAPLEVRRSTWHLSGSYRFFTLPQGSYEECRHNCNTQRFYSYYWLWWHLYIMTREGDVALASKGDSRNVS